MGWSDVTSAQALRLVSAYGLREGALVPVVPPERPAYVSYCDDLRVTEHGYVDADVVRMAVRLWREGWTMELIAAECGITLAQMCNLVTRNRNMFPRRYRRRAK